VTAANRSRAPGERLYRSLLVIYPAEFRELFGEMMVDFYRARVTNESPRGPVRRLATNLALFAVMSRCSPTSSFTASPNASHRYGRVISMPIAALHVPAETTTCSRICSRIFVMRFATCGGPRYSRRPCS
jgi:hypothetical protein